MEGDRVGLGSATETFSKLAVTAADLSRLLELIESDQALLHAARALLRGIDICLHGLSSSKTQARSPQKTFRAYHAPATDSGLSLSIFDSSLVAPAH